MKNLKIDWAIVEADTAKAKEDFKQARKALLESLNKWDSLFPEKGENNHVDEF